MGTEAIVVALLSSILSVLLQKISDSEFFIWKFFRKKKLDEEQWKKLKSKLVAINPFLMDAEEKQITSPWVREWLDRVKEAVYDAEDLVDEIGVEIKLHQDETRYETSQKQLKELNVSLKRIVFSLELIAEEKDLLGLREGYGGGRPLRLPTTCLIDRSEVCLRKEEMEAIVEVLLSDKTNKGQVPVVSIVGMGGIGKTTLAQFLYNEERVQSHFNLKAWVSLSEGFDVFEVTKVIHESIFFRPCDLRDLNVLQVTVERALMGRKFLIVLDDIWNQSSVDWELFRRPLLAGVQGSKIIVTTRNQTVPSALNSFHRCNLKLLSKKGCQAIFESHAFGGATSDPNPCLRGIGERIVEKCKGLPLAAKVLGALLRSKVEAEEWDNVLKSEIWDLPNDKNSILAALKLGYYHLPSHLKRCFAYCSLFPKGHKIEKECLVQLWMAEGLILRSKGKERLEEVGEQYVTELQSRSFFQSLDVRGSQFIMHDLISDLAQYVAGEFYFKFEDGCLLQNPRRVRHFAYLLKNDECPDKVQALYGEVEQLRTFLLFNSSRSPGVRLNISVISNLEATLRTLHVLSLSRSGITTLLDSIRILRYLHYLDLSYTQLRYLPEEVGFSNCLEILKLSSCRQLKILPQWFCDLKNLSHLDLSLSGIQSLPEQICVLTNLEKLNLHGCKDLATWPRNMNISNLKKLVFLDIKDTGIKVMPPGIGNLKGLQSLATFIVNNVSGSMINELKELSLLHGGLSILGLEKVSRNIEAHEARLEDKKYIHELVFEWAAYSRDTQHATDVLAKLQPHANLKRLTVINFVGRNLPSWLGDPSFSNMVFLHLVGCRNCTQLPPLGQLQSLGELHIERMEGIQVIGDEFYGKTEMPFKCLKFLLFQRMTRWNDWSIPEGKVAFSSLQKLILHECPELCAQIPLCLPSLNVLNILECQSLTFPQQYRSYKYPQLQKLRIVHGCHSVTAFPLQLFNRLEDLEVQYCVSLEFLKLPEDFVEAMALKTLKVKACHQLVTFCGRGLSSLEALEIIDCSSLANFWEGGLPSQLQSLSISHCPSLPATELWSANLVNSLVSLAYFMIDGVPQSLQREPIAQNVG